MEFVGISDGLRNFLEELSPTMASKITALVGARVTEPKNWASVYKLVLSI